MGFVSDRFGKRLKEIRNDMSLTQQQMADKLHVSRMAYRYYETAQRTPDIEFLDTVSCETGYTMEYLLGRSENKDPETLGYDKTIHFKAEAVETLRQIPYAGYLMDYVISHPEFKPFAEYAAAAVSEGYLLQLHSCSIQGAISEPPCQKPLIKGVNNEDLPKLYSALAFAAMMKILQIDESLCNEPGRGPSTYELRAAMVMDSYYRRKEKEAATNANQEK